MSVTSRRFYRSILTLFYIHNQDPKEFKFGTIKFQKRKNRFHKSPIRGKTRGKKKTITRLSRKSGNLLPRLKNFLLNKPRLSKYTLLKKIQES